MNVGKMQIKGVPWQPPTGHLPVAPVTLISQWRIKNTKELTLYLNIGLSKNEEAGGKWTKGKTWEPRGQNYGAMAWMRMRNTITYWQQDISELTMIIDYVIKICPRIVSKLHLGGQALALLDDKDIDSSIRVNVIKHY